MPSAWPSSPSPPASWSVVSGASLNARKIPSSSATVAAGRRNCDSHMSQITRSSLVGGKWPGMRVSLSLAGSERSNRRSRWPLERAMAAGARVSRRCGLLTHRHLAIDRDHALHLVGLEADQRRAADAGQDRHIVKLAHDALDAHPGGHIAALRIDHRQAAASL